jgi:hypothetical protein
MFSVFEHPQSEHPSAHDSLQEHLELSHYISVFSASAGRVRYVMFILMVLSITIVIAQWNTASNSWVQKRHSRLLALERDTRAMPEQAADSLVNERTRGRFKTRAELTETAAAYRLRLIDRVFFTDIPGLGITFDINDLGLFSGVAYSLLLMLLVFCLMREHENLYLALFKVMRLHDRKCKRPDGESTANFLYHALAMGTVFTTPPSLARWRPAAPQRLFLTIVFFVPALVQTYIVCMNQRTLDIALAYGAPRTIMVPQYALLGAVLALGIIAYIYADAANKRWRSAFFHLNPGLKRLQQQPWTIWVRLARFGQHNRLQRRLSAQAVQQLVCDANDTVGTKEIAISHALPVSHIITYADVVQMCRDSEGRAMEEADSLCGSRAELVSADVISSLIAGSDWILKTRWLVRCPAGSSASSPPGQ